MEAIDEVLEFWFGAPATSEAELMGRVRRWFGGGAAMDAEVRERFGGLVEQALAGELDGWAATARGSMALVLLLDQFTRNVLRDDPRMYAGDARAQQIALDAFASGKDRELAFVERIFLSMPLLHSEDRAHHVRLAEIARVHAAEAPDLYARMIAMQDEQVAKYAGVLARFGRFPHRNQILGRTSTPAEETFLTDWAERAPPKGARE